MRRLLWITLVVIGALLSIDLFGRGSNTVSGASPDSRLSVPGTYYKTFTGTDFHSLDSDDVVRFASGTGGGVWVKSHAKVNTFPYLELGLDLPTGAQVTNVTFYVRSCDQSQFGTPKLYFGAYTPGSSSFTNILAEEDAPISFCATTLSISRAVSPAVAVDNAQARYVIGYKPGVVYSTDTYPSNVDSLLVGARVTYELPGAFLPAIQR